jgi:hypothetical protein
MDSIDDKSEMICEAFIRDRGWTPVDIRDHLHPPDEFGHNRHNPGAPLRLYRLDRVVAAEAQEWWAQDRQRAKKIRTAQLRVQKREQANPYRHPAPIRSLEQQFQVEEPLPPAHEPNCSCLVCQRRHWAFVDASDLPECAPAEEG